MIARFRAAVATRMGLNFEEPRTADLVEAFERLASASGGGVAQVLARLEGPNPPRDHIRALARHLTVGETYFFRNPDQLRVFADVAIPQHRAERPGKTLRVLSAGCSSGEEAYSLAILARERLPPSEGGVSITAVDINPSAIERATAGVYSAWSLRETPPEVKRRWFRAAGRDFVVEPSLRAIIRFEERNLATPEADLWLPEHYDVIFCRNMLMYFTAETARAVVGRIRRALAPGGYLFLGHAESLRDLSQEFVVRNTHGTFYYQPSTAASRDVIEPAAAGSAHREPQPASADWIEAVRQSSARIRALSAVTEAPETARTPSAPTDVLAESMDLLARERFAEALAILDRLPELEAAEPDVLLVRAALLTHTGQLGAAERLCLDLRSHGPQSAGAHYLLALCREGAGDATAAAEVDRLATQLDPDFAMPRLHLGLLARRAGDMRAARREFEQALGLLAGEDAARILLFGGGFTREALMGLCRSGLQAAAGAL